MTHISNLKQGQLDIKTRPLHSPLYQIDFNHTSPTWVKTSAEFWTPARPSSSRLKVRVGTDDASWGAALTNITRSWHSTIPQLLATLTAVIMLSPAEKWTRSRISRTHAHLIPPLKLTDQLLSRSIHISGASAGYFDFNRGHLTTKWSESAPTSHHDAAKLCPFQDVYNSLAFWLHQVLHHQ